MELQISSWARVSATSRYRVASPGSGTRRVQLASRIRRLRWRFVAAAASSNGSGKGDIGSSDDLLKRVEEDLKLLADAEAAAEAALVKLERDRRSIFDSPAKTGDGAKRDQAGGKEVKFDAFSTAFGDSLSALDSLAGTSPSRSTEKLAKALEKSTASLQSSPGLEFSLEEIEEQLRDKVRIAAHARAPRVISTSVDM